MADTGRTAKVQRWFNSMLILARHPLEFPPGRWQRFMIGRADDTTAMHDDSVA